MNPLLNDYQRHYIEAYKSAHEAIQKLNEFGEHFSHLCVNDKNRLFAQLMAEQFTAYVRAQFNLMFFRPTYGAHR